jgi:hypothetical protein
MELDSSRWSSEQEAMEVGRDELQPRMAEFPYNRCHNTSKEICDW